MLLLGGYHREWPKSWRLNSSPAASFGLNAAETEVAYQIYEPPPASIKKVKHRPYSVTESVGLLGGEARAVHTHNVYTYTLRASSS